jgi:predicted nucleotidyltransferase
LVKEHFGARLRSICVFGSVAKGIATHESDVDVLVVADDMPSCAGLRTEETISIHESLREKKSYRALRALGHCAFVSNIFLTPSEIEKHPPILLDLVDEGAILYDEDGFLARELEKVKRRLGELGAKKVITKKGHFWILKPDAKPGEVVEI